MAGVFALRRFLLFSSLRSDFKIIALPVTLFVSSLFNSKGLGALEEEVEEETFKAAAEPEAKTEAAEARFAR